MFKDYSFCSMAFYLMKQSRYLVPYASKFLFINNRAMKYTSTFMGRGQKKTLTVLFP